MNATVLPERLDITADELQVLLQGATRVRPLVLDGTAVQRVDTAGLQLLCAAVAAVDGDIRWAGVSAVLRDSARVLGLESAIGLAAKGNQ